MPTRPSSVNTLADYLVNGYWRDTGQSPHHFNGRTITVDLTGLSKAGKTLARAALDSWEAVADLRFAERRSKADISFDDKGGNAETVVRLSGQSIDSATVNIGAAWLKDNGNTIGSYGFQTYVHEIGHALGLGHAGNYNGSASIRQARLSVDSWQTSVMSYLDQDENKSVAATKAYVVTPMLADILAIQKMYGKAHGGPTAGDTVWGTKVTFNYQAMTIWDERGNDTLDLTRNNANNRVDLNDGSYSDVGISSSGRHQVANIGIAPGTIIENVSTGSGNDDVTGNEAANVIRLGRGDDLARGQDGNDTLWGEGGNDVLVGGGDRDSFVFTAGNDTVIDFENNGDTLVLERDLWGGAALSAQEVLKFAHVEGTDIVFDFKGDHSLRIRNFTDIGALADDIAFI